MRFGTIQGLVLAFAFLSSGAAGAVTSSRCHVEVLASEELPYAPPGAWLLQATMRVTYPHGPTVVSTLVRNSPWQTTVRRGDTFWLDCERLRNEWTVSLLPMR
jgi:hypothetical protein